jgi:pimeloyl-ACP methyl ester carboxylesterase
LIESNRTVIIIELPHVSTLLPVVYQSFIEQINSPRQVAEAIRDILNAHDIESATFVGHSLGSTVLSWAVKFIPDMVQKAVFIDPVCFLLHHADVAYNFVYRVPRSVDQLIIHYFASREMNTAWFLGRGFVWYDNVLFEADIPKHVDVSIFLSEKDCIVPVQMVSEEYGGRRDVRILKGVNHAEFIVHPELVNAVVQTILSNADNEQCEDESGYFSQ